MTHLYGQNVSTPASKCLLGGVKMTHNNKDYNKTNIHTSIHAISVYANAKEGITKEVDRFAEGGDTGAKASLEEDRVIGEKNSFQRLLPGGESRKNKPPPLGEGDRALGFPEVSLPSFGGSRRAVEGVLKPLTNFLCMA